MKIDNFITTLTADERRAEVDRILLILEREDLGSLALTQSEAEFVDQMSMGCAVSPKQLQWMRSIKDKYLQ